MDIKELLGMISAIISILGFFGITHIRQLSPILKSLVYPSSETKSQVDPSLRKRISHGAGWGLIIGGAAGWFTGGISDAVIMGLGFMIFFAVVSAMRSAIHSAIGGAIFGAIVGATFEGSTLAILGALLGAIWGVVFWTWLVNTWFDKGA